MYVNQARRKKMNLWLLVLIVLFIVALIFTIIHISNSAKANSDWRYSNLSQQEEKTTNTSKKVQNTMPTNQETAGSGIGQVDSYNLFNDIDTVESVANSEAAASAIPVSLNNHTYTFKDIGLSSIQGNKPNQYVELKTKTLLYRIYADENSFTSIRNKNSIKSYIEENYRVQVTSELKTGNINGMDIILCTIADGKNVAYFIITPLNDSESLVLKVYDARNAFGLIQDLMEPFNELEKIKANIQ